MSPRISVHILPDESSIYANINDFFRIFAEVSEEDGPRKPSSKYDLVSTANMTGG